MSGVTPVSKQVIYIAIPPGVSHQTKMTLLITFSNSVIVRDK